jgi:hypothetical protein
VPGNGYRFEAPGGWAVKRAGRTVTASSHEVLVSVTTFPLGKPFRPALWPNAVPELDGVARQLAVELGGSASPGETITVLGRNARRYEIGFRRGGRQLKERIVFLLEGRREYELLCRYEHGAGPCERFLSSFRLT